MRDDSKAGALQNLATQDGAQGEFFLAICTELVTNGGSPASPGFAT